MLIRSLQRGDTLIEVMLAVVVLSAVAVGGFSIMNKGMGISYGVLERTETRSRVSQQMELLTYLRDQHSTSLANGSDVTAYPAGLWREIRDTKTTSTKTNPNDCTPRTNSFYIEQNADTTYKLTTVTGTPNPQTTPRPGDGIWIEAVGSPAGVSVTYIDFYVKACWRSVVGNQQETISSSVRLYDRST